MDLPLQQLHTLAAALVLAGTRLLGLFLTLPLLAMRSWPLRLRITPVLVLAVAVLPAAWPAGQAMPQVDALTVAAELGLGALTGLSLRIAMLAVDALAETLAMHAGFSFAQTIAPDSALPASTLGELIGMAVMAVLFVGDVHLLFIERLVLSFGVVPFGAWPANFDAASLLALVAQAFSTGLVLSATGFAIYLLMNLMMGMINRISPQLNLMSIGFSISVPLALLVLLLVAGQLPAIAELLVAQALAFVDKGLSGVR